MPGSSLSIDERFWSKVDQSGDGCWPWLGGKNSGGYGYFWLNGKNVPAHRVAYELTKGPIGPGLTVDHICHNDSGCAGGPQCPHRRCMNDAHLEAVLIGVNTLRGMAQSALNARKDVCINGHTFSRTKPDGARECTTCKALRDHARDKENRWARQYAWQRRNRVKVNEAQKRWRLAHPDKYREIQRRKVEKRKLRP
jgi:hypothetical protein